MEKYLTIIEKTKNGYSAFSPDVSGCIATDKTSGEVKKNMQSALKMHLGAL